MCIHDKELEKKDYKYTTMMLKVIVINLVMLIQPYTGSRIEKIVYYWGKTYM